MPELRRGGRCVELVDELKDLMDVDLSSVLFIEDLEHLLVLLPIQIEFIRGLAYRLILTRMMALEMTRRGIGLWLWLQTDILLVGRGLILSIIFSRFEPLIADVVEELLLILIHF